MSSADSLSWNFRDFFSKAINIDVSIIVGIIINYNINNTEGYKRNLSAKHGKEYIDDCN